MKHRLMMTNIAKVNKTIILQFFLKKGHVSQKQWWEIINCNVIWQQFIPYTIIIKLITLKLLVNLVFVRYWKDTYITCAVEFTPTTC